MQAIEHVTAESDETTEHDSELLEQVLTNPKIWSAIDAETRRRLCRLAANDNGSQS